MKRESLRRRSLTNVTRVRTEVGDQDGRLSGKESGVERRRRC